MGLALSTSTRQRCDSAKRPYMRNKSPANSAASSPPVPARISMITLRFIVGIARQQQQAVIPPPVFPDGFEGHRSRRGWNRQVPLPGLQPPEVPGIPANPVGQSDRSGSTPRQAVTRLVPWRDPAAFSESARTAGVAQKAAQLVMPLDNGLQLFEHASIRPASAYSIGLRPYFRWNFSTRPAVSTRRCRPVEKRVTLGADSHPQVRHGGARRVGVAAGARDRRFNVFGMNVRFHIFSWFGKASGQTAFTRRGNRRQSLSNCSSNAENRHSSGSP